MDSPPLFIALFEGPPQGVLSGVLSSREALQFLSLVWVPKPAVSIWLEKLQARAESSARLP